MSNKYTNFIVEVKMKNEEIKKAVTAEAAAITVKTDEATVNGENKPVLQDAKTAAEVKLEAKPEETPVQVVTPAELQAAPPAAPAKKEVSFDGLFAADYRLGSSIKQNPNGGNSMDNMKKPQMDYVERAKNHKNVSMTPEQFAEAKANKK